MNFIASQTRAQSGLTAHIVGASKQRIPARDQALPGAVRDDAVEILAKAQRAGLAKSDDWRNANGSSQTAKKHVCRGAQRKYPSHILPKVVVDTDAVIIRAPVY